MYRGTNSGAIATVLLLAVALLSGCAARDDAESATGSTGNNAADNIPAVPTTNPEPFNLEVPDLDPAAENPVAPTTPDPSTPATEQPEAGDDAPLLPRRTALMKQTTR